MESIQNEIPDYVAPQNPGRWYHNGWLGRGTLVIALLFFLLPFIDIKCSGNKLASVSGADLVLGKEINPKKEVQEEKTDSLSLSMDGTGMSMSENAFEKGDQKNIEPNALAIVSMSSVLLSLVFSFLAKRLWLIVSGGLGLLAALSLFFLQIAIQSEIQEKMGPFNFIPISFEFTPFYWCTVMFMGISSVFLFMRSTRTR